MKVSRYVASAAAVLALAAIPGTVQAQVASPVHFGVSAGLNMPLSDLSTGQATGYIINGLVAWPVAGWPVTLRGELAYSGFGGKSGGGSLGITSGYINAVYPITPASNSPYVLGGVGLNHLSYGSGAYTENDFGLNFGGGLRWQMNGMSTFLELRYYYINTSGSSAQMVPLTFGIKF